MPDKTSLGERIADALVTSSVFALIGIIVFALAFYLMVKIAPFSVRKEIEVDQNTALAIIMAGVIIGIALIISAAIHG
jgi:putative membrane protein